MLYFVIKRLSLKLNHAKCYLIQNPGFCKVLFLKPLSDIIILVGV